jgi:hypothetical protein
MSPHRAILYGAASASAVASLPLSFFGFRWLFVRFHEWQIGHPLAWTIREDIDAAFCALVLGIVIFFVAVFALKRSHLIGHGRDIP